MLILTRTEVLDVRSLVTVAEITTSRRGIAAEVEVIDDVGPERESVIDCDGINTIAQATLMTRVGAVDDAIRPGSAPP